MITASRYPYIRAYGKMMGWFDEYIEKMIARAEKDNAPQTAIEKENGLWLTIDDLSPDDQVKVKALSLRLVSMPEPEPLCI